MPVFHLTVAYLKKGHAAGYVGDTRFAGKTLTFPSLTFSPHTGDRVEIPLKMTDGAETVMQKPSGAPHTDQFGQVKPVTTQSGAPEVYSDEETMATPSRQIKLSEGWQQRLAALQAEAGKQGNAPLENGVNITLSDGRTMSNVKVFDGSTLELDKELSMSGVVITDMTPGARPQADDNANETPSKEVNYPTTSPEQQARDAANEAARVASQNAAYTDAGLHVATAKLIDAASRIPNWAAATNTSTASVSLSNPTSSSMNLAELKTSLASVTTIEQLPTAVANVAAFADAIAKASEQMVAERTAAQDAAKLAQASVDQIKADLAKLTATHNEMVASQQAAAAQVKFDEHMAAVAATFDLDDEVRAEIVDEVKAAATDEAFAKWLTSAKKKMKGFMKKKAADDKKDGKDDNDDDDDAKAAKAAALALASASNNPVDPDHKHDFAATASLAEKMKETFANNISVGGVKVSELNKKTKK